MSQGPKKTEHDPFEGLDWDRELEDWDKSAEAPGGASVPESFSKPPPPVAPAPPPQPQEDLRASSVPASRQGIPRPLYRPPTVGIPAVQAPIRTSAAPTPAAKASSDRPLPSLISDEDDDAHQANTKGGALRPVDEDEDEDENRTVVAEVSQDLLAQLEAAGIHRNRQPKPAPAPPAPSQGKATSPGGVSVEIDDEGGEEHTAEHPAPEPEDPSVVTSAPEVVRHIRNLGKSTHDLRPEPQRTHDVREGEMFDPFQGLDLEPPASANVAPPPEGPRLLSPERRRHNPEDETAILDKNTLLARARAEAAKMGIPHVGPAHDADSTAETADPFASAPDPFAGGPPHEEPQAEHDPFATQDPFATDQEGAEIEQGEEEVEGGVIDLLGAEQSSDGLPVATAPEVDDRPAVEWLDDVEAWRARAERVAAEARTLDKGPRARGLIVASEIAAIAGDTTRAIELAEEAWQAAPSEPLAVRQLRQLLASEGRWEEVAPLLDAESKSGSNATVKAHAALLAGDVARLGRSSPDDAVRLYEASQRMSSSDVRPMLARGVDAIAFGKPTPLLKWPQATGAEPLAEAFARRAKNGEPVEDTQLATALEGIAAFADGGIVDGTFAQALDELSHSETLGGAAAWTRVALDAARSQTRASALGRLGSMQGRAADEARLAVSLDLGDLSRARSAGDALAASSGTLGSTIVEQTVHALSGQAASADAVAPFVEEPGVRTIGRGFALANNGDAPPAFAADDALDAAARVARRLSSSGHVDEELRARTSNGARLGFQLADALGGGGPRATVDALAALVPHDATSADESLLRILAALAEGDGEAAVEAARQAVAVEPTGVASVLALLAFAPEDAEATAVTAAEGTTDESRGAALAIRVALAGIRRGDIELAKRACDVALTTAPSDAVATFVSELRARRAGDFDGVLEAVRARAHAAADPVAKAAHLVREIFLLLGTDLPTSIERSQEAAQLVPRDLTIRALYERIAGEAAQGRAEFRAELAQGLEGTAKAETLLDAAREAERSGDLEGAERLAAEAEAAGSGAEAAALRHRVQARGPGAARLADELLQQAKTNENPDVQREIYEQLADLDLFARGDATSAILWHQAILEASPDHLPSLRRLEHMLVSEGREDDYEMIATQLARVLPSDMRDAHAEIAARLRLRRQGTPWDSIADLVAFATERESPSLWATRLLDALARHRGDDAAILRATDLLLARADRPGEIATLATRGAEAAFRTGDVERARAYLDRALEADPQHPTALASLAELRRASQDFRGAAEAIEAMAQTQLVPEHRLEDWHAAAAIWLDRVQDPVRGRAALERAAEIDLGYADVFDRLVELARAAREHEILADLYQRRLGQIEEPEARAQLLVAYARVLVDLGDRDGARAALGQALEIAPTHREALDRALELAEQAEDWNEYEQHLIRMSRAEEEPARQVHVLRRLGALYEGPLPNASRAEAVYRKILEHHEDDDDVLGRLVDVYVRLGDADQAVETHQERVRLAKDAPTRRTRLIELARLLDDVAHDPDRALKALEGARAADPSDLVALAALAEFHTKHGRPDAVAAALDQAIEDLRRRIGDDPGELGLFDQLIKILELRGRTDAVTAVRAAVSGLRGEAAEMAGAEDAAALPELDVYLCPPELTDALRAFLAKAGDAIEKSIPVDLRALKAAKLGNTNPVLKAKIDAVSRGFGLPDPDVVISRAMPLLCLPVGAKPFQIVIGDGLVASDDDVARRFALARTMKVCGGHCASLIRVPPADLKVYLDALLHALVPEHPAPEIDAERLDEITKRLQRFLPRKEEAELKKLGADLHAQGPLDVEALASAAATWGDRVALLAVGDLAAALRGVAWTLGQKGAPLSDDEQRRAWLRDNPAARDLVAFAISDAYLEARTRAGVH